VRSARRDPMGRPEDRGDTGDTKQLPAD